MSECMDRALLPPRPRRAVDGLEGPLGEGGAEVEVIDHTIVDKHLRTFRAGGKAEQQGTDRVIACTGLVERERKRERERET